MTAKDTFLVMASMNPYDNIGTTRLSTSVHDRLCRLAVPRQDAGAERRIVALRAPRPDLKPTVYERLVATRAAPFFVIRTCAGVSPDETRYREVVHDAMVAALSGRIFLDETVEATPEQVLRQIWEDHFILNPAAAPPGRRASRRTRRHAGRGTRLGSAIPPPACDRCAASRRS